VNPVREQRNLRESPGRFTQSPAAVRCNSNTFVKHSPLVPGHEIIGNVVAVGDGEKAWKIGDRVGGAWHGGHDGKSRDIAVLRAGTTVELIQLPWRQVHAKLAKRACSRCVIMSWSTVSPNRVDVSIYWRAFRRPRRRLH
jgi:Alcohol dehydrogenase GroES-like domain